MGTCLQFLFLSSVLVINLGLSRKIQNQDCNDHKCDYTKNIADRHDHYLKKGCYCDDQCQDYGDCCKDYINTNNKSTTVRNIECLSPESTNGAVMMITSCSKEYSGNSEVQRYCYNDTGHPVWTVPVHGHKTELVYRNMFCALCNGERNYTFWKVKYSCTRKIYLNNSSPFSTEKMRRDDCSFAMQNPFSGIIHSCRENLVSSCSNKTVENTIITNCERGPYGVVRSNRGIYYMNIHCFNCNKKPMENLICYQLAARRTDVASYFILIDFNNGGIDSNGLLNTVNVTCSNGYLYDYIVGKCRLLFEPNGPNCTMVKLDNHEFSLLSNGTLFHNRTESFHDQEYYTVNNSNVYICKDRVLTNNTERQLAYASDAELYLTVIGTSISLAALIIYILSYFSLQTIWNLSGHINVSFAVSLILAQLLFIMVPFIQDNPSLCRFVAISMHYFFLASFFWMNVISLSVYLSVCKSTAYTLMNHERWRTFMACSLYSWLAPLLIVIVAILMDEYRPILSIIPHYGRGGICWMTTKQSILLFFAVPLALIISVNMIAYAFSARVIYKVRSMTQKKSNRRQIETVVINTKLCILTGLTWTVGYVAVILKSIIFRIAFVILNSTFGLWVAICFLCTQNVMIHVKQRISSITESSSLKKSTF